MTMEELTRSALPYVRRALVEARSEIIETVTPAGWVVLWPAWAVVTGPLLPLMVRIGIELIIALSAAELVPVFDIVSSMLVYVSEKYVPAESRVFFTELTRLMHTPRSQLMAPVQGALRASDRGAP
jgi:hypothetical protein